MYAELNYAFNTNFKNLDYRYKCCRGQRPLTPTRVCSQTKRNWYKKQDYRVYMVDFPLWIPEINMFTYPDIMVIQGNPIYYENRKDTILNPSLIMEVLSPSTKNYDKEGKFSAYRTIGNIHEKVIKVTNFI